MRRRDRILTAISHHQPDRVPVSFDALEPVRLQILEYYGIKDIQDLYGKTGVDGFSVWDWPTAHPLYTGPERDGVDEYDRTAAYGFWGKVVEKQYPLRGKTFDEYEWPRADHFDFSSLKKKCMEIRDKDMTVASGHAGCGWTHHVQMRSYDHCFYDVLDDAWMEEFMGRNREFLVSYFLELFRSADGMIDIIRADEDLGGQNSMLISPEIWRRWYKPLWKEIFAICKSNGAKIWMHSCGYCRPLIDDFIEIGVDILNPVPPYVKDSDPGEMKQSFGGRLAFDGGVDQINVLVRGTPEQVRDEVKLRIGQMASGGGYIIGPSQVFSADVPFENVRAFFDSAIEYGNI